MVACWPRRCPLLLLIFCGLSGWLGILISMVSFLFFTDMCIYWIHRFLHHKRVYKVGERSSASAPGFCCRFVVQTRPDGAGCLITVLTGCSGVGATGCL